MKNEKDLNEIEKEGKMRIVDMRNKKMWKEKRELTSRKIEKKLINQKIVEVEKIIFSKRKDIGHKSDLSCPILTYIQDTRLQDNLQDNCTQKRDIHL